jgi:hypothetical protein
MSTDVTILAHHGLLLAIPAFTPAIVVAGVVIYIAMRDRRQGDDAHSDHSDSNRHDGAP